MSTAAAVVKVQVTSAARTVAGDVLDARGAAQDARRDRSVPAASAAVGVKVARRFVVSYADARPDRRRGVWSVRVTVGRRDRASRSIASLKVAVGAGRSVGWFVALLAGV